MQNDLFKCKSQWIKIGCIEKWFAKIWTAPANIQNDAMCHGDECI